MQKKVRSFQFGFPVTDLCLGNPTHIGDLMVNAIVYQYGDGTLHRDEDQVTVDIDSIIWDHSNIRKLLEVLAEDTFEEITEAARQHGTNKFEITQPVNA